LLIWKRHLALHLGTLNLSVGAQLCA
jgi:hypothetical protein